jgi:hypothetical protein
MKTRILAAILVFFAFAVLLQWRAGALSAEFGGSDEAAHFVTALMIHDYVASGLPAPPVKFAENYYVHYPKVTFGIWPPLFHLTQAAWILLFSPARLSVLILMALWTTLLATLLYLASREFGDFVAFALGLLLISIPQIQSSTSADMPDVMMTCFMWTAMLAYARYLDCERKFDAILFAVLASIAMLVKYNALCLALIPPFALLFNRRFYLLRRLSFWLPVPVVILLCGPWYIYNHNLVRYAMEPNPGIEDIPAAFTGNSLSLERMVGPALFLLALAGAFAMLRPSVACKGNSLWVSAAALLLSTWAFHSFLYPMDEPRYLLAVVPVSLLFAGAGCRFLAAGISRKSPKAIPATALLLLAGICYAALTFSIPRKRQYGFSDATARLIHNNTDHPELVLVSGPAETEGVVVSEMALADRHLRDGVLRASKVLSHSSWMGKHYESVFHQPQEVDKFLKDIPVSTVVVDRSKDYDRPHHRLLLAALEADKATWELANPGGTGDIQIYRRLGPIPDAGPSLYVDLSRTIGRSLPVPQKNSDRTP